MINRKQFVCFVHIEKAGGITIHNMLHNSSVGYISPSPKAEFGEHFEKEHLQKLMQLWPIKITGIGGHRIGSFLNYEDVVGEDIFYFTFMRNPISRFISHLNWQRNIKGINWSLDGFIDDGYFNNFQCYRISGQRDYDAAQTQIDRRFGFVGLMESYDISIVLLSRKLGHYFNPLYEHSNRKEYGDKAITWGKLSGAQQKRVVMANKEDLRLYGYVKDVIFKRYTEASPVSDFEIAQHLKLNNGYRFGLLTLIKRRITNRILSDIVQPYIVK